MIALSGEKPTNCDMFLKIETAKQGPIIGEAHDTNKPSHENEIEVVSWSWGMRAQTSISSAGNAGKSSVNELEIVKRVDSASTALMAAMRNNDVIKKAVLTVRKAGKEPVEYLRITVQNARITLLDIQSGDPVLMERLALAFRSITVDYVPQGPDGRPRGGMSFQTDIGAAT